MEEKRERIEERKNVETTTAATTETVDTLDPKAMVRKKLS